MTDPTPTTEEVREYLTQLQGTGSSLAQAQAEAIGLWFDRYVIAERKRVAEMATHKENKRITDLLESLKGTCSGDCDACRPHAESNDNYLTAVIELVKGRDNG